MRRTLVALLVLAVWPSIATAAPVLVRAYNGSVRSRIDPFVSGPALTPAPATGRRGSPIHRYRGGSTIQSDVRAAGRRHRPTRTVDSELTRLRRQDQLAVSAYRADESAYREAVAAQRRLHGVRRTELAAVITNLRQMAAAGAFTPSRVTAMFLTLSRNTQWWRSGPVPSSGERIEFAGSQLVWEYYPGQGIELQVLGSFGKADGLYTAGPAQYPALGQLLRELVPLAARRGGGLTWEYYFHFDGGSPPWTSAMSQATGLEALTRAYRESADPYYLSVAEQALGVFTRRPPAGVALPTRRGERFLQYTFAPRVSIINAFLQTLIGLHDYAQTSGNPLAARLFARGNAEAEREVPRFDTGAWSLYQPGIEDSLDYHVLVTGFLQQLCTMTKAPVYCTTAKHFGTDLKTAPVVTQLTVRGRARHPIRLAFRLSKYSHVGVVITHGSATRYLTSAYFPYGVRSFALPDLRPGIYHVALAATDLAGNFARTTGALSVRR